MLRFMESCIRKAPIGSRKRPLAVELSSQSRYVSSNPSLFHVHLHSTINWDRLTKTGQNNFVSSLSDCSYRHVFRRQQSATVFQGWVSAEWHKDTFLSDATAEEKEEWLNNLISKSTNEQRKNIDIEAFLVVLHALSISSEASAARKAERWMKLMLDEFPHVQPTREAYQAVIRAWANSYKEIPAVVVNRSERWLNDFLRKHDENPDVYALRPTIDIYNAFLDACTRGRPGRNKRKHWDNFNNAKEADALLRRLISKAHHEGESATAIPNTESFNFVIRGWTRCLIDELVMQRIMGLVRLMEASQRSDPQNSLIRPNTKSYCLVMDALVRIAKMKQKDLSKKSNKKHNEDDGIEEIKEAESILGYIHDLYQGGVEGVLPNQVAYNIILNGWAALAATRPDEAPFRAEEILRKMTDLGENGLEEASPDRVSYEKVMLAWATSASPNAGKRAIWWLKQLWNYSELEGGKELLPNVNTYNIGIRALAASEGAAAAEGLLLDLGEKYRDENDMSLCPNSESFAIVVKAWLKDVDTTSDIDVAYHALNRAVEWLMSLREIEGENSLSTAPEQYHRVLRAAKLCARERPEVLDLARRVFNDQDQSRHGLDVFAYAYLLDVGLESLRYPEKNEERTRFIETLCDHCRDDGLLGAHFVRAITQSKTYSEGWTIEAREEIMHRIFHTWPFPPSWNRSIRSPLFQAEEAHFRRTGGFDGPPVVMEDIDSDSEDNDNMC